MDWCLPSRLSASSFSSSQPLPNTCTLSGLFLLGGGGTGGGGGDE